MAIVIAFHIYVLVKTIAKGKAKDETNFILYCIVNVKIYSFTNVIANCSGLDNEKANAIASEIFNSKTNGTENVLDNTIDNAMSIP